MRRIVAIALLATVLGSAETGWQACATADGAVLLQPPGRDATLELTPACYGPGWKSLYPQATTQGPGAVRLDYADGPWNEVRAAARPDGCSYTCTWNGIAGLALATVEWRLPERLLPDLRLLIDGTAIALPASPGGGLFDGLATTVALAWPDAPAATLRCTAPVRIQVIDNRRWTPQVVIRLGTGGPLDLQLGVEGALTVQVMDGPEIIRAGDGWIAMDDQPDTAPGSALDASLALPPLPPPERTGRVVATPEGHLAFASDPGTPVRFWGANLVKEAVVPEDPATGRRLAAILVRHGFNAVRLHQHDLFLADPSTAGALPAAAALERWDTLIAALRAAGLRLTTDAAGGRQVPARVLWPDADDSPAQPNQVLAVNERAFASWRTWAHALFGHVNPHTGLSLAQDPALILLALTNEANPTQFLPMWSGRVRQDWDAAWQAWRLRHGLAEPLPLPRQIGDDATGRAVTTFLMEAHGELIRRQQAVLRDELGCRALTTALNGWCKPPLAQQGPRALLEVVDEHFYDDHPRFPAGSWTPPFVHHGDNPTSEAHPEMRWAAYSRIVGRPFTVTEFNCTFPNPHRAGGTMAVMAMAGLQGWDALWRFAWSHSQPGLGSGRAWAFDLASDPLSRMADRVAALVFRRGDIAPARAAVAVTAPAAWCTAGADRPVRDLEPGWSRLAWLFRVGTRVDAVPLPGSMAVAASGPWSDLAMSAYAPGAGLTILGALANQGWRPGPGAGDPLGERSPLHSDTGEIRVDPDRRIFALATLRSACGSAPAGTAFEAGALRVQVLHSDATVAAISLDGAPLPASRRILAVLLTQVVNSGTASLRPGMRCLSDPGRLPHLLRRGQAELRLRRDPGSVPLDAWALDDRGLRCARAGLAQAGDGQPATLTLDGAALPTGCLAWELVAR